MISLKKYLEMNPEAATEKSDDPEKLLPATLKAYRSALTAAGNSAARACPPVGSELQQNLTQVDKRLDGALTVPCMQEAEREVAAQLDLWEDRTKKFYEARTNEVKELLLTLARTAESVGERDHRYSDHFGQFTNRLKAISNLEDLTNVRATLVREALELKTYVDKMEQDSNNLVKELKTEVSAYETKLKEVEELALRDALTGLANRRNVEERIEQRIASKQTFCAAMLDVNKLKRVNDEHGHLAGDSLLQQFAQELRSALRGSDVIGRWGGDEFMIVMDCNLTGAKAQIERVHKWVFGDYTIRPGKGHAEVKVHVDAAIGLTQWQSGQTLKEVVEHADAAMYQEKQLARAQHA
ncbi:MAG TPA: GGDEF domain-containing protein [Terriglobales bacterium]|nr:GGDEF domain-containing protein [Terriglobales bacterium]